MQSNLYQKGKKRGVSDWVTGWIRDEGSLKLMREDESELKSGVPADRRASTASSSVLGRRLTSE